jgi:hypothetical protein
MYCSLQCLLKKGTIKGNNKREQQKGTIKGNNKREEQKGTNCANRSASKAIICLKIRCAEHFVPK